MASDTTQCNLKNYDIVFPFCRSLCVIVVLDSANCFFVSPSLLVHCSSHGALQYCHLLKQLEKKNGRILKDSSCEYKCSFIVMQVCDGHILLFSNFGFEGVSDKDESASDTMDEDQSFELLLYTYEKMNLGHKVNSSKNYKRGVIEMYQDHNKPLPVKWWYQAKWHVWDHMHMRYQKTTAGWYTPKDESILALVCQTLLPLRTFKGWKTFLQSIKKQQQKHP